MRDHQVIIVVSVGCFSPCFMVTIQLIHPLPLTLSLSLSVFYFLHLLLQRNATIDICVQAEREVS
jgi:hypothetical protein